MVPHMDHFQYISNCSQCGSEKSGRPGEHNSIWAHKFYCFDCIHVWKQAKCSACQGVNRQGQLGHAGTKYAKLWFCAPCWKSWNSTPSGGDVDSASEMVKTSEDSHEFWRCVD